MEQALQYTQQSPHFGNDLTPYTEFERKIITVCAPTDNPAINDSTMLELKSFAMKLYNRAAARYGNSAKNDDNAQEQIKLLVEDLMRYPLLRVKEVSFVLDEGVGIWALWSCVCIVWAYRDWETRRETVWSLSAVVS